MLDKVYFAGGRYPLQLLLTCDAITGRPSLFDPVGIEPGDSHVYTPPLEALFWSVGIFCGAVWAFASCRHRSGGGPVSAAGVRSASRNACRSGGSSGVRRCQVSQCVCSIGSMRQTHCVRPGRTTDPVLCDRHRDVVFIFRRLLRGNLGRGVLFESGLPGQPPELDVPLVCDCKFLCT